MKNKDFSSAVEENEVERSSPGLSRAIAATPSVQNQYEGTTRRIRLMKKRDESDEEMWHIMKPLRTKKMSTPKAPQRRY
jgi:hypothetical protein